MSANRPKISIITISYNIADEIGRTIDSIKCQVFKDFEWVVVDGRSTDGTAELLHKHDKNISKLLSAVPAGPYDAMNKGAELARGELICFINGGDELYNANTLNDVWDFYIANKKPDMIYGDAQIIDGSQKLLQVNPSTLTSKYLLNNMVNHQAIYCKLTIFKEIGGFKTEFKICADYDWLLRALVTRAIVTRHIRTPVARFHLGGLSSQVDPYPERALIQSVYFGKLHTYYRESLRKGKVLSMRVGGVIQAIYAGDIDLLRKKLKKRLGYKNAQ